MNRLSKMTLLLILTIIMLTIPACNNEDNETDEVIDTIAAGHSIDQTIEINQEMGESIAEVYRDIYDEALAANTLGSFEVMRSIVMRLGNHGYVAVDSENQIDMTEYKQVVHFCEQVDVGEKAELTILVISRLGGFTKYDLKTEDGNVNIVKGYYQYVDGVINKLSSNEYRADLWQFTEEGYLLFSGHWFLQEQAVYVLNERDEYVALRVQPLDSRLRELNRQYIFPVGYGKNNMFLVDWSEDNFGELNFYDLFDIFYPLIYGQYVPYVANENWEVGAIYRIPEEEFETVIMTFLNIDIETLRSKTIYFPEDATYEYRPRGFYEIEYKAPYSEVVGYVENSDGSITLTVNVVYPDDAVSKVYSHEVVIRPLSDGKFQYVSNKMIPSDNNYEQTWHVSRLTEEEWEKVYKDIDR